MYRTVFFNAKDDPVGAV